METSAPPQSAPSAPTPSSSSAAVPARRSHWGTLRNLEVVIVVALLLATLFTAWTPGDYLGNFSQEPASLFAIQPQPTARPEGGPTDTPRARPLIGIVSGHWGNDSGAVCADGLTEADVNQNIAVLVQKYLVEEGYDVDLLKEFDPRLTSYKATALVSIHNDSCDFINDQATGFKVASAMASPRPERAARLTACLRSRYGQISGLSLHSTSVTPDMTSYHAFGEMHEDTTAAIIETGFLNLDRELLTQRTDVVAQGVVSGILCYLRNEDVSQTTPAANP